MTLGVRRVVTGHDDAGKAVVRIEDVAANLGSGRANHAAQVIWTTGDLPVNFAEDGEDKGGREIGTTIPGGSVFRLVEYRPGVVPRNHRTDSIDYAVVISGEIDMEMDGTMVEAIVTWPDGIDGTDSRRIVGRELSGLRIEAVLENRVGGGLPPLRQASQAGRPVRDVWNVGKAVGGVHLEGMCSGAGVAPLDRFFAKYAGVVHRVHGAVPCLVVGGEHKLAAPIG